MRKNLIANSIWLGFLFGVIWISDTKNIDQMEKYVEMEDNMIMQAQNYLSRERQRLDSLKKQLQEWKTWRSSYKNKEAEYITIPQNIFHLFKKLTLDLENLEKMMLENSYNDTLGNNNMEAPTDDDMKRVILSMVDLQYLYDLNPHEIMKGQLMSHNVNVTLSVDSCMFIAETCFEHNEYICVIDWLSACFPNVTETEQFKKSYKMLYRSHLFLNNLELAFNYADSYLSYDQLDIPATDIKLDLGYKLGKLRYFEPAIVESRQVCQGMYKQFIASRNLTCRYNHENSAFLKIAPLKEEVLQEYPKMLFYRDGVYNSEINILKEIALKNLATSTVYGSEGNKRVTGFVYRISQTAFIDNKLPQLSMLAKRIQDLSGLSLNYSEWWQVVNYSPGGFYRVHSDYLPAEGDFVKTSGNRMTTLLFYLNDVTLGGETVFPHLKLSVTPERGSVLIWHNVLPDGSENPLTLHSACPVILGEKWIFTQWLRAKDQKTLRHIYEKWVK